MSSVGLHSMGKDIPIRIIRGSVSSMHGTMGTNIRAKVPVELEVNTMSGQRVECPSIVNEELSRYVHRSSSMIGETSKGNSMQSSNIKDHTDAGPGA